MAVNCNGTRINRQQQQQQKKVVDICLNDVFVQVLCELRVLLSGDDRQSLDAGQSLPENKSLGREG
jgi:hypothetical protein